MFSLASDTASRGSGFWGTLVLVIFLSASSSRGKVVGQPDLCKINEEALERKRESEGRVLNAKSSETSVAILGDGWR